MIRCREAADFFMEVPGLRLRSAAGLCLAGLSGDCAQPKSPEVPRQGCCGLFELLGLSRRANQERAAAARPGAQKYIVGVSDPLRA